MKTFIVGGREDYPSKLVEKIKIEGKVWRFNGYPDYEQFVAYVQKEIDRIKPDLIIWLAEAPNKKIIYIKKPKHSILIYSNIDEYRKNYDSQVLALSHLNKMKGNATILIFKKHKSHEDYELIDALGNIWVKTDNFKKVIKTVIKLYHFTLTTKRKSLQQDSRLRLPKVPHSLTSLLHINTQLIIKIGAHFDIDYFGKLTTKCTKLFPSMRHNDIFYFSARDINKDFTTLEDMIHVEKGIYYDDRKCAIDTPVHLEIYKQYPHIKYIIHGHAYIKYAITTDKHHPCGDLNGVKNLKKFIEKKGRFNIKGHGFLIYGRSIQDLKTVVKDIELIPKPFEKR